MENLLFRIFLQLHRRRVVEKMPSVRKIDLYGKRIRRLRGMTQIKDAGMREIDLIDIFRLFCVLQSDRKIIFDHANAHVTF